MSRDEQRETESFEHTEACECCQPECHRVVRLRSQNVTERHGQGFCVMQDAAALSSGEHGGITYTAELSMTSAKSPQQAR